MIREALLSAGVITPDTENSVWYNGHTFSFLLDASQTAGAFSLIHCHLRKGGEPPAHYHQREDETFYVLEGAIRFHVGDKTFNAKSGDTVYVAKGVPHVFSVVTETAKAILLITPGGLETFFREFSTPATSIQLPAVPAGQPPAVFMEKMMKRAEELGMVWMPQF